LLKQMLYTRRAIANVSAICKKCLHSRCRMRTAACKTVQKVLSHQSALLGGIHGLPDNGTLDKFDRLWGLGRRVSGSSICALCLNRSKRYRATAARQAILYFLPHSPAKRLYKLTRYLPSWVKPDERTAIGRAPRIFSRGRARTTAFAPGLHCWPYLKTIIYDRHGPPRPRRPHFSFDKKTQASIPPSFGGRKSC